MLIRQMRTTTAKRPSNIRQAEEMIMNLSD